MLDDTLSGQFGFGQRAVFGLCGRTWCTPSFRVRQVLDMALAHHLILVKHDIGDLARAIVGGQTLVDRALSTVRRSKIGRTAGNAVSLDDGRDAKAQWNDLVGTGDPGRSFVLSIDPRAVLLRPDDIDQLFDEAIAAGAGRAFSGHRLASPIYRLDATGRLRAAPTDEALWVADGAFAVSAVAQFDGDGSLGVAIPLHIPEAAGWCLRVPGDIAVAEVKLRARGLVEATGSLPQRPAALIMDFDGVFTDNRVQVDQDGRETVTCDRSDGLGLERLKRLGLPLLVLSKERNPVVAARCAKLKLEHQQALDDKLTFLRDWLSARGLSLTDTIYIGNDVNDLPCMEAVGCAVAPADAYPEAKAAARIILSRNGGQGALRELADMLAPRL